jgi:hypothetical protein
MRRLLTGCFVVLLLLLNTLVLIGPLKKIQNWVYQLWIEKDQRIDALRAEPR